MHVYSIPLITYFPAMEGVAHINENCDVSMCILFSWSPIFPTWRGLLTEMRIAMSVYVYYSFDHLFFRHGGGCWEKWEFQCLYVYIIPLINYFPTMEGVAHINENCNASMFILFPWSPISPTWRWLLTEMRIAMSVHVYYSFDHLFFHHGGGCWEKLELRCLCVYLIPLIAYFPKHGGGCSRKWELQCLYVYIIPLVTHFPKHGGGCWEKWELQCLCVYIIPLITYFPNMEWVAHWNEIAMSVCVYYSFDHLFPQHGMGCSQKWELQCLHMYIIPSIIYFPSWRGMLREMIIAMYVCVYYSLDHIFPQHGGGCWQKWELQCL